ncbi:hypothetical protein KKG61_06390 [bacterium]|nr:hypothetical protein [bacterium]
MIISNIWIIFKLLFILSVLFVLLPGRLFKPAQDDSFLDTFFINLTHIIFITILTVHFLILIKMYEFFTLLFSYILIFSSPFIYSLYKDRSRTTERFARYETAITTYFLDILDRQINPLANFKGYLVNRFASLKKQLNKIDGTTTIYILLFTGVAGYAAYLRFYDSFHHVTLGTADPYPWVKVVKEMERNNLFSFGLYPEGFFSIVSVVHLFSFLDLVHIFRFFGPLMCLVIVLSIYYVTYRITKNKGAAIVAMFIYGTFTDADLLPIEFFRQTTTLPQEISMVFFLPTLYFLLQFVLTQKKRFLLLFFEGLIIVFRIAPVTAVMAFWGVVSMLVFGILFVPLNKKVFSSVFLAGLGAVFLGYLSMALGSLTRHKLFYASHGHMVQIFTSQRPTGSLELPYLLYFIYPAALSFFIYSLIFARDKKEYFYFPLLLFALLLDYRANFFHLRHILEPLRTAQFIAMVSPIIIGLIFHVTTTQSLVKKVLLKGRLYPLFTAGAICALAVAFPAEPPIAFKMGYDASMVNYLKISGEYTPLQWLIVSQVEEYPLILYEGWHLNTADFLEKYNPFDQELSIDTPNIFLFVEKRVFRFKMYGCDPSKHPQRSYDYRYDQMRRMEEWCKIYMLHHSDMNIFSEDENLIVYAIHKR